MLVIFFLKLRESIKQDFNQIIVEEYGQNGFEDKTNAFDELQQRVLFYDFLIIFVIKICFLFNLIHLIFIFLKKVQMLWCYKFF
jgi:hypothetical protein